DYVFEVKPPQLAESQSGNVLESSRLPNVLWSYVKLSRAPIHGERFRPLTVRETERCHDLAREKTPDAAATKRRQISECSCRFDTPWRYAKLLREFMFGHRYLVIVHCGTLTAVAVDFSRRARVIGTTLFSTASPAITRVIFAAQVFTATRFSVV